MHGRFSCPQITDVPREEWPDVFNADPTKLMECFSVDGGLQLHIEQTLLRQWENRDLNVATRMWSVSLLMREIGTDTAMRFTSFAPVQAGDTPDTVGMEFAHAILKSIDVMLQEEQGDCNGTE